jgi:hypothetical protein
MDGFEKTGLNEDNFGSANGSIVSAFDAFRTNGPPFAHCPNIPPC